MNKKLIIVLLIGVLIIFIGMKISAFLKLLETDEANAKVSISINQSKKNGMFISDYQLNVQEKNNLKLNSAWIEYVWKNEIKDFEVVKKKLDGIQLIIDLKNLNELDLDEDLFLLNWEIAGLDGNELQGSGRSGNLHKIMLRSLIAPDTINLAILTRINVQDNWKIAYRFSLIKK